MIVNSNTSMDIMAKALDAYTLRNSSIANNIANADTPGYKRQEVKFESLLDDAMKKMTNESSIANRNTKTRIANQIDFGNTAKGDNLINSIKPEIYDQEMDSMYRIDGNNIDIDNEMAELVKNQLRYSTVLSQINKQFAAMRTAMGK